jgi:hypothetical protein
MIKISGYLCIGLGILLSVPKAFSCDCPNHPGKITRSKSDSFDIIMRASVVLPFPCSGKESLTRFEGIELFKGKGVPKVLEITHDCASACRMPFDKGQEWLLYIKTDTAKNEYRVNYCERSRMRFSDPREDNYTLYNEMTYDEEINWLRKNLLPAYFIEPEQVESIIRQELTIIDQNRNIRFASDTQKLLIVGGSFIFMIVLIWVIRKFLK